MTATAEPRRLDVTALREGVNAGTVRVLDVRTPAEFETAHVPGSYNVPLDTLREHREELRNHLDEDVVLVCRSGVRATQAEQALAGVGLPNLRVLDGGIVAWEKAGGELRRGRQRWELERQVRLVAGSIVLTSVVASAVVPGAQVVAGAIGAGLAFAALSNSCLMGRALMALPYNRDTSYDLEREIARLAGDGPGRAARRAG
ncbi:rhodanese-like domain-containing protein [Aquipuribacter nitratireducens]|uniref:Rhodanese-like domain-containing protein n=1 Tax=Aquipuribacter nitratireducens TaxID=650104 RepID=A0ABW0GIG8_9MICO